MATITLYSGPLSMFGAKAQIALLEKALPHRVEMVPFSLAERYEPKHPEVARINPKRQVPVLVEGDLELYDSTQIFEYLEERQPEPALWPSDLATRARARQLEFWSDEVFFPHAVTLMGTAGPNGSPAANEAVAELRAGHAALDARAAAGPGPYLVEGFGYADIATAMATFFAWFLGVPPDPDLRALAAWWNEVGHRDAVGAVMDPMRETLAAAGLTAPPRTL